MNSKNSFCIISTGKSMIPTLMGIEFVKIKPYENEKILPGDIILFSLENTSKKIIHRVIKHTFNGIKTQGDNNSKVDPWIIQKKQVLGKVEYIIKNGRPLKVKGGLIGLIQSYFFHFKAKINNIFQFILYNLLKNISKIKTISKFLRIIFKIQIIEIQKECKNELQILAGRKIIGQYKSEAKKWLIKVPYRFFINEKTLPIIQ